MIKFLRACFQKRHPRWSVQTAPGRPIRWDGPTEIQFFTPGRSRKIIAPDGSKLTLRWYTKLLLPCRASLAKSTATRFLDTDAMEPRPRAEESSYRSADIPTDLMSGFGSWRQFQD